MQTEYKRTREEEAFFRLLDEKQSQLSEDTLKLIGLAQHEAYQYNLVSNYAYQPSSTSWAWRTWSVSQGSNSLISKIRASQIIVRTASSYTPSTTIARRRAP